LPDVPENGDPDFDDVEYMEIEPISEEVKNVTSPTNKGNRL